MTLLHLGVYEQNYRTPGVGRKGKGRKKRRAPAARSITTYDVAQILEARYHIMEVFWELHRDEFLQSIMEAAADNATNVLAGMPPSKVIPAGDAMNKMKDAFNKYLDMGEMESMGIPGVPTKAALAGVSHRFAHPYSKVHGRRPSFIDTGLYESSFVAWLEP